MEEHKFYLAEHYQLDVKIHQSTVRQLQAGAQEMVIEAEPDAVITQGVSARQLIRVVNNRRSVPTDGEKLLYTTTGLFPGSKE